MALDRHWFFGLLMVLSTGCGGNPVTVVTPVVVAPAAGSTVTLLPPRDMPGLERQRQARVYLPPGYATSSKRYPVLYMHDGQNLFDNTGNTWNVKASMDSLSRSGRLELIVVGIDNGPKRLNELNGWSSPRFGAPEGKLYMDFIVNVVKPLIDKDYRTLPDRANTALMGASMGGVVTHYAVKQYPTVFGKAGIFSPYYFVGPDSFDDIAANPADKGARLYMLMGGAETGTIVSQFEQVYASVLAGGHPAANVTMKIVPNGVHHEVLWSAEFTPALLWLFAVP